MPRWSYNTDAMNARSLEDAIQFGIAHGFEAVEICGDKPQGFFEEVDAPTRARCRGLAEEAGMRVTAHSPIHGTNVGSSSEAVRAESMRWLRGGLDLARDMGAELYVVHASLVDYEDAALRPDSFRHCVENLRALADDGAERGIRLGLENITYMPDTLDRSIEELVEVYEAIGHRNVSYVIDFGHAYLHGGYGDIDTALHLMGGDLAHIHLTDNHGKRDDHIEIGTGTIDYTPYVEFLRAFPHSIVLELTYYSEDGAEILRSRDVMDALLASAPAA